MGSKKRSNNNKQPEDGLNSPQDKERKVENLRYMKLEVMQLKIKNKYEIPACE